MDTIKRVSSFKLEFLKLFLPGSLIFLLISMIITSHQKADKVELINFKEKGFVQSEKNFLEANLYTMLSDAVFLSQITAMHFNEHPDQEGLFHELSTEFLFFTKTRTNYDHIRYILSTGMEFIRINITDQGQKIIEQENMQDKKSRPYFINGIKAPGAYISRFDLNIEHGRLEIPYKPVLRLTTPVFNDAGKKLGLIVLNCKGKIILNRLKKQSLNQTRRLLFINSDGFFLSGPTFEDEWGFVIKERESKNMAALFPKAWKTISSKNQGQLITPKGLFTFTEIDAMALQNGTQGKTKIKFYETWKIISQVPPQELVVKPPYLVYEVCALLIFLLGAVSWFLVRAKINTEKSYLAIEEREQKFRIVTDTVRDAIVMIDGSGKPSFWNPAAQKMFGYDLDEVAVQDVHSFIAPEKYRQRAHEGMKHFKKTGKGCVLNKIMKLTALRKDKTEFPVELLINTIKENGQYFAIGTIRDTSERKEASDKLRELSDRFSLATKSAKIGVWEWNILSGALVWNESMYDLYGVNKNNFLVDSTQWLNLIHPEDRENIKNSIRNILQNQRNFKTEFRIVRTDGAVKYIKATSEIFRDHHGKPSHVIGTNWDVTYEKKAELAILNMNKELEQRVAERTAELEQVNQELRKSEDKFLTITTAAKSAIIMVDASCKITFWNRAAETIFGWENEEAVGKKIHDLIAPAHYMDDYKLIFPCARGIDLPGITGKTVELIALKKNGDEFPIEVAVSSDQRSDNMITISIISDISQREKTKNELEKNIEELERFTRLSVGREKQMINLKREINELLIKSGRDPKYNIALNSKNNISE